MFVHAAHSFTGVDAQRRGDFLSGFTKNPIGAFERGPRAVAVRAARHEPGPFHRGGLAPWQFKLIKDHIVANLDGRLPIPDLARIVRLSPSHFARAFRMSAGVSPHAFVVRARMEEAKRLMRQTAQPLCAIAATCGLADQAHLCRLFRRFEGVSPAVWRRFEHASSRSSGHDF